MKVNPRCFPWLAVTVIAVMAFAARAVWIAFSGNALRFPDEHRFWCEAQTFAAHWRVGCGTEIAHDMPLTAMLFGFMIRFLGAGVAGVKVLLATLSSLTVYPVARIAWRLHPAPAAPVFAGLAFAFYPFSVYYSGLLLSETVFLLFTSLWFLSLTPAYGAGVRKGFVPLETDDRLTPDEVDAACEEPDGTDAAEDRKGAECPGREDEDFAVEADENPEARQPEKRRSRGLLPALSAGIRQGVWQGIWSGLAHLTRPTLMYFLPVAWLWTVIVHRRRWVTPAVSALVIILLTVPWVMRNYDAFGEFIPGTLGSGHTLWEGNNPWNDYGGVARPGWGYLEDLPPGLNELEKDRWEKERAVEHIRSDPARFLRLSVKKFLRFWNLTPNAEEFDQPLYRWISLLSFGPVLCLSLLSPLLLWRRWRQWGLLWLFAAYYTALHVIALGSIRYRLPLEPLLIAMAGASLAKLCHILLTLLPSRKGKPECPAFDPRSPAP